MYVYIYVSTILSLAPGSQEGGGGRKREPGCHCLHMRICSPRMCYVSHKFNVIKHSKWLIHDFNHEGLLFVVNSVLILGNTTAMKKQWVTILEHAAAGDIISVDPGIFPYIVMCVICMKRIVTAHFYNEESHIVLSKQ